MNIGCRAVLPLPLRETVYRCAPCSAIRTPGAPRPLCCPPPPSRGRRSVWRCAARAEEGSIGALEFLDAAAVADLGGVDGALGVDGHVVHPLEVAGHVAR